MSAVDRITKFDRKVTEKVVKLHRPVLNGIMIFFTKIGIAGIVWFVTLGIPMLFFNQYRHIGICTLAALGCNYVLSELIVKNLVGRKRPSTYLDDDDMLINKPKDASFPSGHASSSFSVLAVAVLLCPWYIVIPACLVACTIAFSRVYLQVHYLSDVIAGAVFGFMIGCTVVSIYFKIFGM